MATVPDAGARTLHDARVIAAWPSNERLQIFEIKRNRCVVGVAVFFWYVLENSQTMPIGMVIPA
jgi:hypothetical protein